MQLLKQEKKQEKFDLIKRGVVLAPYTTFRIGGKAEYFALVHTKQQLLECLNFCKENEVRYFILGKGSNVLFDDRGYRGMVIVNRIETLEQRENRFIVSAGYSFVRLGQLTAKLGYGGLEFASGIPGSVGGAIYMNAGAQGSETKDTLEEVLCFFEGKELVLKKDQMKFGYRFSNFQQEKKVILEACFVCMSALEAKKKQRALLARRIESQPCSDRSCGCVFQNPLPFFAGKLIEEAGMKGHKIGGAMVSFKHANFIVNTENALAADVLAMIASVKQAVFEQSGIVLHEEVRFVAYE